MTNSLQLATWLAHHGLHVFPLRPYRKRPFGNCQPCKDNQCDPAECQCLVAARPCHGYLAATTHPTVIQRWWTHTPSANVGISTGPSGLVVLDLDRKPKPEAPAAADVPLLVADGLGALHAISEADGADVPKTLVVATPSGGRHLYFRVPDEVDVPSDATGRVGHQIDVRAQGGYVLAPGSRITAPPEDSTGSYTRISSATAIAPLPEWLCERVMPFLPQVAPPEAPNLPAPRPGHHSPGYWRRIWDAELTKVEHQDGERWRLLYASARRLANLAVHDTAPWTEVDVIDALVDAAVRRRQRTGKPIEQATARRNATRGWQRGCHDSPDSLRGLRRTSTHLARRRPPR